MLQSGQNTMMLVKDHESGKEIFKLIAISLSSPFLEARFQPTNESLVLISKTPIDQYQLLPKLDEYGFPKINKAGKKEQKYYDRHVVTGFYDYSVTDKQEIIALVNYLDSTATAEVLEKYFVKDKIQAYPLTKEEVYEKIDLKKLDENQ